MPEPLTFPAEADWLAWRRGGLGASDAAAVLGLDPWRGPIEVWLDKTGQLPATSSEAMELGHALEPVIADRFTDRTSLHVYQRQTGWTHSLYPWMRATVDGVASDGALWEA